MALIISKVPQNFHSSEAVSTIKDFVSPLSSRYEKTPLILHVCQELQCNAMHCNRQPRAHCKRKNKGEES